MTNDRKQSILRYAASIARPYRLRMAAATLAGILRVAAGLAFVFVSKRLVDIATGHAEGEIAPYIAALAAVVAFELVCSTASARLMELTEAAMRNSLRLRLMSRLMHARWQGREAYHTGDLLARLTEDVRTAAENLCRTLPAALVAAVQLVAAFALLWMFSPTLALTLLVLLPLFLLAGKAFFRRIRRHTARIRRLESRLHQQMQESLQHRLLLLTLRQADRTLAAIAALQRSLYARIRRRTDFTNYSRTVVMAGFEAGYMAAFLWGIYGLQSGAVTFGMMTAYLQLAAQIQRPIGELARHLPALVQTHTALERLRHPETLPMEEPPAPDPCRHTAPTPADRPTAAAEEEEETPPAGIRFSNVTFAYPGKEQPTLRAFSHYFAPGSRTAVMGATGAGKSTLLRLALALLAPQEGSICLQQGTPVGPATRRHLVYVPQGNTLLSGTIRRNLLLGNPRATDDQMRHALHAAAADFVFRLPHGIDTPCGEHGSGLSEGQAQRIAVARGLLRPGTVLLLDEISASLDEETETLLMQRLTRAYPRRTLIIVTHRPQVAQYCNETLFINNI